MLKDCIYYEKNDNIKETSSFSNDLDPKDNPNLEYFKKYINKSSSIYEIQSDDDLDDINCEMESLKLKINNKKLLSKIKSLESKGSDDYKIIITIKNKYAKNDPTNPRVLK